MLNSYYNRRFHAANIISGYVLLNEVEVLHERKTSIVPRNADFRIDSGLKEAVSVYVGCSWCSNTAFHVLDAFIRCRDVQDAEYDTKKETRPQCEIIRAGGQCPPKFDCITENELKARRAPLCPRAL